MLCKMWGSRGIDKPCVFRMPSSDSGLGAIQDTVEPGHLPGQLPLYKYGSSFLVRSPADRGSPVRMDIVVYMEREK